MSFVEYDKLEKLPSLKKGWVRLVHRCVMGNGENVRNIKANGLIFNRYAAKCNLQQKGGSYNYLTSMVSVYNEDTFWQSMQRDDFACFNDDRAADTKLVFDIPMEEFCFLQAYGRFIKGKVDNKYLVGCVENVNAQNLRLRSPISEILRAERISRSNLASDTKPNNVATYISHLIMKFPKEKREEKKQRIAEKIEDVKTEISDFFSDEKRRYSERFFTNIVSKDTVFGR